MDSFAFYWHAAAAALMGTAIGLERQWHLHTAGLRTNALVAFGSCLFVSLPGLLHDNMAAHLAGQIVVGMGFLGGGVILKEGLTVRGLNTAATMWCSAAIGALVGTGFPVEGLAATGGVLAVNVCLRPVSDWLDRRLRHARDAKTMYRLHVACAAGQEAAVRGVLMRFFHDHPTMLIQAIATQPCGEPGRSNVVADICSEQQDDKCIEDMTVLVGAEVGLTAVTWEKNPVR
jgi:putative Mg2+ transporter-C (MgtC) family protein